MHKVEAIIRHERLQEVQDALDELGVSGLRAGFGGQHAARIPISQAPNPSPHPILKEIHSCEVAGRELTAANPHALMAKARAQLEAIAPGGALPLVWFRAPATDYELPVYE